MKEKPYIGITGISQREDAKAVSQMFKNQGLVEEDTPYQGMVGYLVSLHTLRGRAVSNTKYPSLKELPVLVRSTMEEGIFTTLHYFTPRREDLFEQLIQLLRKVEVSGLQINIPWPTQDDLARVKDSFPELKIIFQLGPHIIRNNSRKEISNKLRSYNGLLNYVLIDPSGGRGQEFDARKIAPLGLDVQQTFLDSAVIFAGGFKPENITKRLEEIGHEVGSKNFGIDTEEGIRSREDINDYYGKFSLNKAGRYIQKASKYFLNS